MPDEIIIGVDTGGTFTDFVFIEDGRLRTLKVLSTPSNPAQAVCEGIEKIAKGRRKKIVHGSTVATNALLERKGAETALITTKGFEDIIEIGRQNRTKIYSLKYKKEPPLIPEDKRLSVNERTLHTGEVLRKINLDEVREIIEEAVNRGAKSIAVSLLFSFANPQHEEIIGKECIERNIPVSLSHRIVPEFREYERTSTTVINAYVSPVMEKYISQLNDYVLGEDKLTIMQSNGGCISADTAMNEAVKTILSGPAGGVVGASSAAFESGIRKIISFDMGGTSTDVSLIDEKLSMTTESYICGMPVKIPMIDIHTVGAGGGSIARFDEGGALRVGPESAGADPGPICYGRGNEVTVTDAHLFLSRLSEKYFLDGLMKLNGMKVETAIKEMAKRNGIDPLTLAEGIIEVANSTMEKAIRVISVEKGYDIRDFYLLSFGGAGGLHAVDLAESLSMRGVIIPYAPGVLSAIGMVKSDIIKDYSSTVMLREDDTSFQELTEKFKSMEKKAVDEMMKEGVNKSAVSLMKFLDMRYEGQSYEIIVPFTENYIENFNDLHKERYGYSHSGIACEIVNLRIRAIGKREMTKYDPKKDKTVGQRSFVENCNLYYKSQLLKGKVYSRQGLDVGETIVGPAIIVEYSATTFIPPHWQATIDENLNIFIHRR
ncbi:MAG: hydantoinase/oxoprolinase family protein [Candidatus Schekmanbacteria bacterium]|nr:MAG: hydantoinase/oxoprolinase family protein [Candidatus Schekmanbacteria bacterium]